MSSLPPEPADFRFPKELAPVLLLAFAEPPPEADSVTLGEAGVELAERLGLAARLGQRHATPFEGAYRRAAAGAVLYEEVARRIAAIAATERIPVVLLKGLALHLRGDQPAGRRPFADLDLIAPPDSAPRMQTLLVDHGFEDLGLTSNEHHLPALASPIGGVVEVHFHLRGLRVAGERWATATELLDGPLVRRLTAWPGSCWLPRRPLLAAHLLVHGLQHASRPETYPLLWMAGDLAALLPDRGSWEAFRETALPWLHEAVPAPDLQAVEELCLALVAGRLPERDEAPGAARLLRHIVAGALDEGYRESLKLGHVASRLADARRQGALWSYLRRKLLPSTAEAPEGRWQRVRRLVHHLSHGWAYRLGRRRGGSGAKGREAPSDRLDAADS